MYTEPFIHTEGSQLAKAMVIIVHRAVGSSPWVGRVMDQSDDAAEGSEIEVCSAGKKMSRSAGKKMSPLFSVIRMGSRGTFVL